MDTIQTTKRTKGQNSPQIFEWRDLPKNHVNRSSPGGLAEIGQNHAAPFYVADSMTVM